MQCIPIGCLQSIHERGPETLLVRESTAEQRHVDLMDAAGGSALQEVLHPRAGARTRQGPRRVRSALWQMLKRDAPEGDGDGDASAPREVLAMTKRKSFQYICDRAGCFRNAPSTSPCTANTGGHDTGPGGFGKRWTDAYVIG